MNHFHKPLIALVILSFTVINLPVPKARSEVLKQSTEQVSAEPSDPPLPTLELVAAPTPEPTVAPTPMSAPKPVPTPNQVSTPKPQKQVEAPGTYDELLKEHFGDAWENAKKIAYCESGLVPTKHNYNSRTGDDSWGLFQINLYGANAKNRPSSDWLVVAENNIKHAASMYKSMGRFGTTGGWYNCAKKVGVY